MGYSSAMHYAAEFFGENNPTVPRGRGSGDKSRVGRKSDEVREESDYVAYAQAKARREAALADKAEIEVAEMVGSLVNRQAVRDGSAKAFSTIAQSMRAIPDILERRLGLSPEILEEIEKIIDESLESLGKDLEKMENHGLR